MINLFMLLLEKKKSAGQIKFAIPESRFSPRICHGTYASTFHSPPRSIDMIPLLAFGGKINIHSIFHKLPRLQVPCFLTLHEIHYHTYINRRYKSLSFSFELEKWIWSTRLRISWERSWRRWRNRRLASPTLMSRVLDSTVFPITLRSTSRTLTLFPFPSARSNTSSRVPAGFLLLFFFVIISDLLLLDFG